MIAATAMLMAGTGATQAKVQSVQCHDVMKPSMEL